MKSKKLISLILTVVTVLSVFSFSVSAKTRSGDFGNGIKWNLDNNGTLTVSGTGETPGSERFYFIDDEALETYYFAVNEAATSIVVSEGITKISDNFFSMCERATSVTLPESLVEIGTGAFQNCYDLDYVHIPKGVTEIAPDAFRGLENITIDEANPVYTTDEQGAIYNKDKTILYSAPCAVYTKDFVIPSTVTTIGKAAFCDSSSKSITIPESVTKIEDYAFSGNGVSTLHIPKSVTYLGVGALNGSHYMQSITIDSDNPMFTADENAVFNKDKTKIIRFFKFEVPSYEIPYGVVTIGEEAFAHRFPKSVTIPSTVTTIEESAFDCSGLESIVIPSSVTTLGRRAFAANSIKEVTIPGSVEVIGEDCFIANDEMTGLTIEEGVREIGAGAFDSNSWLQIITVPGTLTKVGENAISSSMVIQVNYPGTKEDAQAIDIAEGNYDFEKVIGGFTFKEKVKNFPGEVKNFFKNISYYIEDMLENIGDFFIVIFRGICWWFEDLFDN